MSDDDSIDEAIGTFRATMAAHGRALESPKPVRAKRAERNEDGELWTNVLNGVEYRFSAKKNLWVATGHRGPGMLD